jgi:hypothetical protein
MVSLRLQFRDTPVERSYLRLGFFADLPNAVTAGNSRCDRQTLSAKSLRLGILSNLIKGSLANLLCRFSTRRHRSEIMLGVLVVVFCPDYIAGLSLSFR